MKVKNRLLKILIGIAGVSMLTLAIVVITFSLSGRFSKESEDKAIIAKVQAYDEGLDLTKAKPVSLEALEPDLLSSDAVITTTLNDKQTEATIKISGISSAQALTVAVWSKALEQDDMVWYDMVKSKDGVFSVNIPIKAHHTEGEYLADAYVVRKDSSKYIIANTAFSVEGPSIEAAVLKM